MLLLTLARMNMTWPDDIWLQFHLFARVTISLAENCAARVHRLLTSSNKIWFGLFESFQTAPGGTCKTFCQGNLVARPLLFWSRPHMWNMPCDSDHNDINNHIDDDGAQVVGQWVILNWLLTFYYIAWTPESPVQEVEQGGWLGKCLMNVHVCARGYICVLLCVFLCDCFCVDCDIAD